MASRVHVSAEVAAVRALYAGLLDAASRRAPIREQLRAQAARLASAHAAGDPAVHMQIASWHPSWIGRSAADILASAFSEDDARVTIAREYGYSDWADVEARGAAPPNAAFEDAVDAALDGDLAALAAALNATPELASAVSDYGHRATLLHYMAANGVESWRQVAPLNADAVVAMLISAGADANAEAPIYGGARPLGLLLTSAHPEAAGLTANMAAALRAAGAI